MSKATARKNVQHLGTAWSRLQDVVEKHTPRRTGNVTDNAYTVSGKRGW